MFVAALVYLIVLVVWAIYHPWTERWQGGIAQIILFSIIGFVLFWSVLNK